MSSQLQSDDGMSLLAIMLMCRILFFLVKANNLPRSGISRVLLVLIIGHFPRADFRAHAHFTIYRHPFDSTQNAAPLSLSPASARTFSSAS